MRVHITHLYKKIDGSRVPIIGEGGGAEAWTSAVYYPSEDLVISKVIPKLKIYITIKGWENNEKTIWVIL